MRARKMIRESFSYNTFYERQNSKVKSQNCDVIFKFLLFTFYLFLFHFHSSILIKYPPTTLLAWKPTCFPSVVSCQSLKGTRVGVCFMYLKTGSISVSK